MTNQVAQRESDLSFKIATETHEFEQIHRLQYATFVEEIPQHPPNERHVHVDKFHDENTYIICHRDSELLGTVALRDRRPFALERRLENLDSYLPKHTKPIEMRLLAAREGFRQGKVFPGLAKAMGEYCMERGFDLAIISATTRQPRLYRHLGFVPFGPLVGTPGAMFQPMYLTLDTFRKITEPLIR